jgi:DNA topoisomerase-2
MDQVVNAVLPALKKKHKDIDIKPAQIKSFFFLFVSCAIENPAFDSQTKENMTTKVANFGSEFIVS